MKLIAIEHEVPGKSAADFAPHLRAEAQRVWELSQLGLIRESYFRADRDEAVLVLECASVEEAEEVLGSLPLVQAGLIQFEVIPLKAYPGFTRLFTD